MALKDVLLAIFLARRIRAMTNAAGSGASDR
jgi:hypothetical protein